MEERVGTLVNQLQQLYQNNAPEEAMLITAKLLVSTLTQAVAQKPAAKTSNAAISLPNFPDKPIIDHPITHIEEVKQDAQQLAEEKIPVFEESNLVINKNQIDELNEKLGNSLTEIKEETVAKTHDSDEGFSAMQLFDSIGMDEVPTMLLNEQLNENQLVTIDNDNKSLETKIPDNLTEQPIPATLNDKLKEEKTELITQLALQPITDLRKAIGINDRFQFIEFLFNKNENAFDKAIQFINQSSSFEAANNYLESHFSESFKKESTVANQFYTLVRRRFL